MEAPARNGFTVLGAGLKAFRFLSDLETLGHKPTRIISYPQPDDQSSSFESVSEFAARCGACFERDKRPTIAEDELAFVVGWQFLLNAKASKIIVFHDSLLPKYRGFAPTVSALINGERKIGVSALLPVETVDAGSIVSQKAVEIEYPITIGEALSLQAQLMAELAASILSDSRRAIADAKPQDESGATYSIWRDDADYRLDWTQDAARLARTVDALGPPYVGAQAMYENQVVLVKKAHPVPDISFEIRQPGKIWMLDNGAPIVVCQSGLLKITSAHDLEGRPVTFTRLRRRFS